jgi:hypothetical protein
MPAGKYTLRIVRRKTVVIQRHTLVDPDALTA